MKGTFHVNHRQLPLQPGFAVTGHSAQGKTLEKVLVNLKQGGCGAYVSASRATTRYGLCITQPVTLPDLDKPLHPDLLFEARRFHIMAQNTLIEFSFCEGTKSTVPDAESECQIPLTYCAKFKIAPGHLLSPLKRKHTSNLANLPPNKKPCTRVSMQPTLQTATSPLLLAPFAGCTWTESDWSCAYDTTFMTFYFSYRLGNPNWWFKFRTQSSTAKMLAQFFDILVSD
jgi:hypothetical protein